MSENDEKLGLYLQDHFAGGVGAIELLEHLAELHEATELGAFYQELLSEVKSDHQSLHRLMIRIGVEDSKVRNASAWVAEKLSRAKLGAGAKMENGLSNLQALETLFMGITGKRLLWRALGEVDKANSLPDEIDFGELEQRAVRQLERVEARRLPLAESIFRLESSSLKP